MTQPMTVTPITDSRATLPASRAFVVQLRADAGVEADTLAGRVEHVTTGSAASFGSVDEMLGFMREALVGASRGGGARRAD
jgi:hypothetical protein